MADSVRHHCMKVGIATQETGTEPIVHTQHVLNHQYLSVYPATGSDTDNRNSQFARHALCQRSGNLLQYNGKASDRKSVV